MGPTAEVVTDARITEEQLLAIDALLSKFASKIIRTRRGRVWTLWIGEHTIDVSASGPTCLALAAGLNSPQDYALLRDLGQRLATRLGGIASEPIK